MTKLTEELYNALLEWRVKWIGMDDEFEMLDGCKCEQCNLVRAFDNYLYDVKLKQVRNGKVVDR